MTLESVTIDPKAESIVREIGIPPCPQVLVKLMAEMNADDTDLNKVGHLISRDVGLSAAILKLTNSPFYGLRNKATTIHAALFAVGLRAAGNLVAAMMLRRAFASVDNAAMRDFWDRSSKVGLITAYLGRELGLAGIDEAHTFAMFRDCGKPLLLMKYSDYDSFVKIGGEQPALHSTDVERSRYGVDHAVVGGSLAMNWYLPDTIWRSIQSHHAWQPPANNTGARRGAPETLIALGELADLLYMVHRGACGPERIEQEEDFLRPALGIGMQDIEPLRPDIERILNGV